MVDSVTDLPKNTDTGHDFFDSYLNCSERKEGHGVVPSLRSLPSMAQHILDKYEAFTEECHILIEQIEDLFSIVIHFVHVGKR